MNSDDNIIFFGEDIFQITYDNLIELIINKSSNKEMDRKLYEYLINYIFFYSINEKEVDIMKKYLKEIEEMNKVLKNEFKIDIENALGYI